MLFQVIRPYVKTFSSVIFLMFYEYYWRNTKSVCTKTCTVRRKTAIRILMIKITRRTNFSYLFWIKLYMFRTVPLSIIRSFSLYTQQCYVSQFCRHFASRLSSLLANCLHTFMTHTIAVWTVKNSWWWTEELSETCRVSFQNKFEKLVLCVPSWSCSQAVYKPVWHIPLLCEQLKTPDDGPRNCPKHVEFHSE